jgi:hypothetical protein
MIVPSLVAVRYALGAPLRPLVVTNIYNEPVYYNMSKERRFLSTKMKVSVRAEGECM